MIAKIGEIFMMQLLYQMVAIFKPFGHLDTQFRLKTIS